LQQIRIAAQAGFEDRAKCCRARWNRIAQRAFPFTAQVQLTFMSLSPLSDLRRGKRSIRSTVWRERDNTDPRELSMKLAKILGLAAIGGLLMLAAPAERAQALSLANPAAASAVQESSKQGVTEVRWHHHRGYHHRWHRHCWRCR
jgi:hypothetical protein